jgi:hypothetical protein
MGAAAESEGTVYPFTEYSASLKILPNPVNTEMVIQYGNMGDYFDVKIFNANGTLVYTAPRILSGQSINIGNLQTGVYFLKINNGKETITKKLIKR